MEKKVMNTRLAVALLFGLLLAGQEAAAVGYDDAAPATEVAPAAKASAGYAPATEEAAPTTEAAPASDAVEATPIVQSRASYGKAPTKCEVPGTCDVKAEAVDPTRPAAVANEYTRGCSKINGCRG